MTNEGRKLLELLIDKKGLRDYFNGIRDAQWYQKVQAHDPYLLNTLELAITDENEDLMYMQVQTIVGMNILSQLDIEEMEGTLF
jgi:hypothetical protein